MLLPRLSLPHVTAYPSVRHLPNAKKSDARGCISRIVPTYGARKSASACPRTGTAINEMADGSDGGAIYNFSLASMTIKRSTLAHNHTTGSFGGAVVNDGGQLLIVDSLLYENSSGYIGGAIQAVNSASTQILNSTLSGNVTNYAGAALFVDQPDTVVVIENSTIVDNVVTGGELSWGGIYNSGWNGDSTVQLASSIVASNAADECGGSAPITSLGHNLDGDNSCDLVATGDRPGVAAQLGPLADNGGPTLTHLPLLSSPAIDGGDNASCPVTDQRGEPRPADGDGHGILRCDMGAVESRFVPLRHYLPLLLYRRV